MAKKDEDTETKGEPRSSGVAKPLSDSTMATRNKPPKDDLKDA